MCQPATLVVQSTSSFVPSNSHQSEVLPSLLNGIGSYESERFECTALEKIEDSFATAAFEGRAVQIN